MTWNPVTGCSKISQGCTHCYAERMAHRLRAMGAQRYRNGFEVTLHEDLLELPLRWKSPRLIFVNSMSDLFHEKVPLHFIQSVFETMRRATQHQFQVLTKRSARMAQLACDLEWPENVWAGVTVENDKVVGRIEDLRGVPAAIRFLSLEPLIGPIKELRLQGIDWAIVGGESGPGARPMQKEWVLSILDECRRSRVPFFFKQWGGVQKFRAGRTLNGQVFDEMPKQHKRRDFEGLVDIA